MNNLCVLIALFYCLYKTISCALLPSDIQKCHFGDSRCLVESINDLIRRYPNGIPEIGLAPLNAVKLDSVPLSNSSYRGPFWMTFNMFDYVSRGLENTTVTKVKGFNWDPTKEKLVIEAHVPRILAEANYNMQGRVLLFRANTSGTLQSDIQNYRFKLTFKIILEYRNNKRYLKIYGLVPLISIDRWIMKLDNLYAENTDLTIALNRLFNENWVMMWNDLEPGLLDMIAFIFTRLLNKVFENVAYDDLFLPNKIGA